MSARWQPNRGGLQTTYIIFFFFFFFFFKEKQCLGFRRDYWTLKKKLSDHFFWIIRRSDLPLVFLQRLPEGSPYHSCGSLKLTWWILNQKSYIISMYESFTSRRRNIQQPSCKDLVSSMSYLTFSNCVLWWMLRCWSLHVVRCTF